MQHVSLAGQAIQPSKIICVGRNYVDHVKELENEMPDEPVIFLKPNSTIADSIYLPSDEALHYEAELCFLIKSGQIAAVAFGLDLTKRALQTKLKNKGLPWERAKAFDGSALFSEFIPFEDSLSALRLEFFVNDKLTQAGSYLQMIFKMDRLLETISADFSLQDGDIIMSGTPKGVGPINAGDKLYGKVFTGDNLLVKKSWLAE